MKIPPIRVLVANFILLLDCFPSPLLQVVHDVFELSHGLDDRFSQFLDI
ncbi:MAG: hypothetical protein DSM106950_24185 [Stigonema ocellatum SAG 48.90 = DSM 106950]|nr:hypothetical protein [Stigonema ocellatum SAG 48.90 = DSM 106950]